MTKNVEFHALYLFNYYICNTLEFFFIYCNIQIRNRNMHISFCNKKPNHILNFWSKSVFECLIFSSKHKAKHSECLFNKTWNIMFNLLMNSNFLFSNYSQDNVYPIFLFFIIFNIVIFSEIGNLYLFSFEIFHYKFSSLRSVKNLSKNSSITSCIFVLK